MATTQTKKKTNGRPYSLAYTAAGTPRRYLLSGIPAQLWIRVRAQAKREHIAVRQLILRLVEDWLLSRERFVAAEGAAQRAHAHSLTPGERRELAAKRRSARGQRDRANKGA